MHSAAPPGSLRTEFVRRGEALRVKGRLPRPGEELGLTADLAPPSGKPMARRPAKARRLPRLMPARRSSPDARTLLTMSVIFSWFGL